MQDAERALVVACIPAFNEERYIADVVKSAVKYVDKVIVCDDGSSDLTGELAKMFGAEVIRHEVNRGYGAALASLFRRAEELGADVMVILDADGQHDPSEIPKLVKPVLEGEADIVVGSRFLGDGGRGLPWLRRMGIRLITLMCKLLAYRNLTDAQSGFRAYSKRAIQLVRPTEKGMGASTEILLKARANGLRLVEVPVKTIYDEKKPRKNVVVHGLCVVASTLKHALYDRVGS
ncbi:MAG: glycosyltransferase family 2 protein [Thermoprotei archaeon]|nr:MAG: glycosyltransferase family 2 protein [Thermoprotei archaeon]